MSDAAKIRWRDLYSEAELYRTAVKLYTKPLFQWRKALSTSWDERTLYDFARQGIQHLEAIHRKLAAERFRFRPGAARTFSFNGKRRTLYIFPWEERVVDRPRRRRCRYRVSLPPPADRGCRSGAGARLGVRHTPEPEEDRAC